MSSAQGFLMGGDTRDRLYALLAAHQKAKAAEWDRQEAERQKAERAVAEQEKEAAENFGNEAAQGAAIGTSIGGFGLGTLIGGIAGSALGTAKDYQYQRKQGKGFFDAAGTALGHGLNPLNALPDTGNLFGAASTIAPAAREKFGGPKPLKGNSDAQNLLQSNPGGKDMDARGGVPNFGGNAASASAQPYGPGRSFLSAGLSSSRGDVLPADTTRLASPYGPSPQELGLNPVQQGMANWTPEPLVDPSAEQLMTERQKKERERALRYALGGEAV